jgi:hypothetical protein
MVGQGPFSITSALARSTAGEAVVVITADRRSLLGVWSRIAFPN